MELNLNLTKPVTVPKATATIRKRALKAVRYIMPSAVLTVSFAALAFTLKGNDIPIPGPTPAPIPDPSPVPGPTPVNDKSILSLVVKTVALAAVVAVFLKLTVKNCTRDVVARDEEAAPQDDAALDEDAPHDDVRDVSFDVPHEARRDTAAISAKAAIFSSRAASRTAVHTANATRLTDRAAAVLTSINTRGSITYRAAMRNNQWTWLWNVVSLCRRRPVLDTAGIAATAATFARRRARTTRLTALGAALLTEMDINKSITDRAAPSGEENDYYYDNRTYHNSRAYRDAFVTRRSAAVLTYMNTRGSIADQPATVKGAENT